MDLWQFTPYLIAYFASAGISFFLAYLAWNVKSMPSSKVFSLLLLAVGVWITSYAFEISVTSLDVKLFLLKIEYAGLILAVYLWFIFVINYTRYTKLLNLPLLIVLAFIPIATYIQVLSQASHNLFYHKYELSYVKGLWILTKEYGIGFYLWAGYSYFILLSGLLIVVLKMASLPRGFRKQIIPLVVSMAIVIIPNAFYLNGINPLHPYDPTCLSFVVVGIVLIFNIQHQKFLDVVPVAHNLVIKKAKTGIVILDEQDRISEMNPAAQKVFNCNDRGCIDKPVTELLPNFEDLIQADSAREGNINEISFYKNRTYEVKVTSFQEQGSKSGGRIIMLWDITELKTALNELDAYAHTVAHDLKTPLSQMIGFADLMMEESFDEEKHPEFLKYISRSGQRMSKIIDELLVLAKIRDIDQYEKEPIDMAEIVNYAISRIQVDKTLFSEKINIIKPSNWPVIGGNKYWIEEIWANYLSNAYKYGGNPPVIEIGYNVQINSIHCWVKDNGNGISPEEQAQLFSKFSRLEKHKKSIKGYGMGLTIVQRIVEKLGGEVWVESETGKGSTFYFSLPCD